MAPPLVLPVAVNRVAAGMAPSSTSTTGSAGGMVIETTGAMPPSLRTRPPPIPWPPLPLPPVPLAPVPWAAPLPDPGALQATGAAAARTRAPEAKIQKRVLRIRQRYQRTASGRSDTSVTDEARRREA